MATFSTTELKPWILIYIPGPLRYSPISLWILIKRITFVKKWQTKLVTYYSLTNHAQAIILLFLNTSHTGFSAGNQINTSRCRNNKMAIHFLKSLVSGSIRFNKFYSSWHKCNLPPPQKKNNCSMLGWFAGPGVFLSSPCWRCLKATSRQGTTETT